MASPTRPSAPSRGGPARSEAASDPEADAQLASTKNALFGDRKREEKSEKKVGKKEEKEEKTRSRAVSNETSEDDIDQATLAMSDFALGELNLTNEEWDLDDVDSDLEKFQQDSIVKEALSKGVDLRHYSRQIQSELRASELLCVDDYMNESDNLATLHGQIKICDGILERMESMLTKFQGDLGAISSEIKHLQDKSQTMDIKVKNRRAAENKLKKFIDSIHVPDDLITQLDEGEIDEKYVSALKTLDIRIKFLEQPDTHDTLAYRDVSHIIHKLKLKAIARIREHLLNQFHALKKPKTNFQMKQQQKLLKIKYTYQFLLRHAGDAGDPSKDIAREVRVAYIETLSKIYLTKFKRYLTDMKKLQLETKVEKSDVIGFDESKSHGFFGTKKTSDQITRIFTLSNRDQVLSDAAADIIIFTSASATNTKYPFERLFRSSQQLLMDNATSEYDFIVEFFGERMPRDADKAGVLEDEHRREQELKAANDGATPTPPSTDPSRPSTAGSSTQRSTASHDEDHDLPYVRSDRDKNMFVHIFVKTISAFLENAESYLFHSWDPLGLLLLIRIICQHNKTMQQKRVHCLDSFFDRMNGMLWKQFKQVMDENIKSLTTLKSIERDKRIKGPHYVIVRYGELAAGIHKLNKGYNDEILLSILKRLRTEVDRLLTRTTALQPQPKAQIIFLINNYNAIKNILDKNGASDTDDYEYWKKLSQTQIELYIEQELSERIGRMITYLKDTEFSTSGLDDEKFTNKIDQAAMEAIIKNFAKYWKDWMQQMHASVKQSFQEEATQADIETIIKQLFIQLVMYHERFTALVRRVRDLPMSIKKDVIPNASIMYEIKQYTNRE